MTNIIHDELSDVTGFILESVVFAFSEALEVVPEYDESSYLTAEIAYSGSRSGTLTMIAPESLCQEWASMMSDDESESIVRDTLAELSNVIAGHWVSRHFTANEDIKLNPPRVSATQESQWKTMAADLTAAALSVDGVPVLLHVTTQE